MALIERALLPNTKLCKFGCKIETVTFSWLRRKLGKRLCLSILVTTYQHTQTVLAALLIPVYQHMSKYLEIQYHDHGFTLYYTIRYQQRTLHRPLVKSKSMRFQSLVTSVGLFNPLPSVLRYLKKNILDMDLKELGTNFQAVYMDPPLLLPGEEPSPGKITIEQLVSVINRSATHRIID